MSEVSQLLFLLTLNSFTMRNSHFFVGLFIMTMFFTLICENHWCKIIGVCMGISFLLYLEASKWIKRMIKIITGCFEKVYEILHCIIFLQQDSVIESAKLNTEIKLLKKTLLELLQSEKKPSSYVNNNPGNVRKHASRKSNKCLVKTESNVVQTNICQSGKKVFEVGDCKMEDSNSSFIQTWDISCLTPDHMKKHFKICMEKSCCKVKISDQLIRTNLFRYCKPAKGKSIDFYQFLTRANGRIRYFCRCIKCQNGNTESCLKNYCNLCTFPKILNRITNQLNV